MQWGEGAFGHRRNGRDRPCVRLLELRREVDGHGPVSRVQGWPDRAHASLAVTAIGKSGCDRV